MTLKHSLIRRVVRVKLATLFISGAGFLVVCRQLRRSTASIGPVERPEGDTRHEMQLSGVPTLWLSEQRTRLFTVPGNRLRELFKAAELLLVAQLGNNFK